MFVIYCVLLYGVFLCLCARAWGLNVFMCIVSELLCAVLQCVLFVVSVRVLRVVRLVYGVMLDGLFFCFFCVWVLR